jgi:hypothetical protein
MEHAQNGKQKIVSNFAWKGLQEKQSRMKEKKGKEAALLLLPTWDLYTRYENSGELPPEFTSTTKIFYKYIFPVKKNPFFTYPHLETHPPQTPPPPKKKNPQSPHTFP